MKCVLGLIHTHSMTHPACGRVMRCVVCRCVGCRCVVCRCVGCRCLVCRYVVCRCVVCSHEMCGVQLRRGLRRGSNTLMMLFIPHIYHACAVNYYHTHVVSQRGLSRAATYHPHVDKIPTISDYHTYVVNYYHTHVQFCSGLSKPATYDTHAATYQTYQTITQM